MKQVNLPEDLESANDRFFTHPVVEWFLHNAGNVATIDWNTVFDKKDKENKYKNLHTRLTEITDVIVKQGGKGYFWLITSPQLSDILGTMKSLFVSACVDQLPLGYPVVLHQGILDKRWRIYSDLALTNNKMLMGAGFSKKHVNYYCNITIENYK